MGLKKRLGAGANLDGARTADAVVVADLALRPVPHLREILHLLRMFHHRLVNALPIAYGGSPLAYSSWGTPKTVLGYYPNCEWGSTPIATGA